MDLQKYHSKNARPRGSDSAQKSGPGGVMDKVFYAQPESSDVVNTILSKREHKKNPQSRQSNVLSESEVSAFAGSFRGRSAISQAGGAAKYNSPRQVGAGYRQNQIQKQVEQQPRTEAFQKVPQKPEFQPAYVTRRQRSQSQTKSSDNTARSAGSRISAPIWTGSKVSFLVSILVTLIFAAVGIVTLFYLSGDMDKLSVELSKGRVAGANTNEILDIQKKINETIAVDAASPQILMIEDPVQVKAQDPEFFGEAEKGDYVFIYTNKIVLYDSSVKKIAVVGNLVGAVGE